MYCAPRRDPFASLGAFAQAPAKTPRPTMRRASALMSGLQRALLPRTSGTEWIQGGNDILAGYRDVSTAYDVGKSTNIKWHEGAVTTTAKEALLGQRGCVVWFTGLSGSGKSTVACTAEHALIEQGKLTALLDGDNIRHGLNKNLGFSAEDRAENIRRIGEVSKLFADTGLITLVSFISPYRKDRDAVRARLPQGRFIEVYMKVPIEVCEQRDPKGLYKKARAGQLKGFTGIDDPYEEPLNAELALEAYDRQGRQRKPQDLAAQLLEYLQSKGILQGPPPSKQ